MPGDNLSQTLGNQYEQLLVRQAETIRDWPVGRERTEQAQVHVRTALLDQMRRQVSQATLTRCYSILSFVMPKAAAHEGESTPLPELEREADIETTYYQQLERQSCPECGDGVCPAHE